MKAMIVLALVLLGSQAWAGPTKLGNGDDGMDLEGATPIKDGPVVDARAKALELVKRLDTPGVAGLGMLIPELETSNYYLAQQDTTATLPVDQSKFHSDLRGLTYARTFATPHAATRFFPAAMKLSQDQLVALEIHEALHRALPEAVREDEASVAAMTLAITSPDATHDQIMAESKALKLVPDPIPTAALAAAPPAEEFPPGEDARINNPSLFGYSYRSYQDPKGVSQFPVHSMQVLQSFLYPFGNSRSAFGFGIEASLIDLPDGLQSGPLSLSARTRLWSGRGYDIGLWGVASLNTLSTDELKNSPFGRDVYTLGISMRKDLKAFYVENFLSYSASGQATQTFGMVPATYSYGGIVNASVHGGASVSKLRVGGFAEVYLADYFRFSTPSFAFDSGRYRIVGAGPELSWMDKSFCVTLAGRLLVDATQGANYDYLGNIMGPGVAQGNLSATVSIYF
jgi:hypothetical protein